MCGGACTPGVVVHQRVRRRRSCVWRRRDVDEVLEASEPVVVRFGGGAVAEELCCHEQRSVWAGRRASKRGRALAPRWMRGLSVLAVLVVDVFVVAVVLILGVLHAWLRSSAPRSAVGARTAAWPGGADDGLGLSSA